MMKQANQVNRKNCVIQANQVKQVQVSILREAPAASHRLIAGTSQVNWVNQVKLTDRDDSVAGKHSAGESPLAPIT